MNALSPDDAVSIVRTFWETYHSRGLIANTAIKRAYQIENPDIEKLLYGETKPAAKTRLRLQRFAQDILADEPAVIAALGTGSAPETDVTRLMRSASLMGSTPQARSAVNVALTAFTRARRTEGLSAAVRCLPGLLYYAYRYCTPVRFISILRRVVIPALEGAAMRRMPQPYVAASLGQLAGMLNEGGAHHLAGAIFDSAALQIIKRIRQGDLYWCVASAIRNDAHRLAWSGESSIERAIDGTIDAQARDPSANNRIAVVNTRCEIHLTRDARSAWRGIEQEYLGVRQFLSANFDVAERRFTGEELPYYFQSYGTLLLGLIARCQIADQRYLSEELALDIEWIEALQNLDQESTGWHTMRIAHLLPLRIPQLHPDLQSRLDSLLNRVSKPPLATADRETIRRVCQIMGLQLG
ncbi:MAG: hypothetical protein JNG88_12605 [Phycisphaerales bacterium]|nr:hypothetical protein [Phycisphaerales bacterium]